MRIEPVIIAEYDSAWPDLYVQEREHILQAIGSSIIQIEHIGSTAVPGLRAKPIIDIMPVLEYIEHVKKCIRPLQDIGYEYKGEFGIPNRHFFLKYSASTGTRTHHLHIVAQGDAFITTRTAFRDYLRACPETANEYQRLKIEMAARYGNDRESCTNAKTEFIGSVLATLKSKGLI